jgi:hypothetical protein
MAIENWNGFAVLSWPTTTTPWLWDILKYRIKPDHWRAAIDPTGWIASNNTIFGDNGCLITKQIYSNAFLATLLCTTAVEASSSGNSGNNCNEKID